jgi:hypothetical protein
MVDESMTFGLGLVGVVLGLAVMLYGVSLTSGESLTTPTAVGGAIVLLAIGFHTYGVMALPERERLH